MAFPTILQVIPELDAGGAERTTLEVAEAIIAAGGRALVASKGGRLEGELLSLGAELFRMDAATKNPATVFANAGRLADIIRREDVAIIHARSRAPAWSAKWAAQRTNAAFVTTYHGTYSARSTIKRRYNAVMASGERVIANSDYVAQLIQDEYGTDPARIITIPRGVDINRFSLSAVSDDRIDTLKVDWGLGQDDGKTVFLLPGRLTDWKGQRIAIEALARLPSDQKAACYLILAGDAQGRDDYVNGLKALIEAQGLDLQVRLVGHCSDMPAAFKLADLVLAPSTRTEAFGRVAAEALAMERPAIVSDHGGQREIVEDGVSGFRVRPGDPVALSEAIARLLAMTDEQRTELGRKGASFVRQRYTKTALQSATLSVYKDVLQMRSGDHG